MHVHDIWCAECRFTVPWSPNTGFEQEVEFRNARTGAGALIIVLATLGILATEGHGIH